MSSENGQSEPVKTTHRIRSVIIHMDVLLLAFLLGFVPKWLKSRNAERQLSQARIANSLAFAAIDARRGDYETARQDASDFFTVLRTETSKGADSALSQAQKDGAQPLLAQRDQVITLLARGDVSSADALSDLYVAYQKLVSP